MAPEDSLLAGCDAAGFGLRVADCSFHRTCRPRVARTRDGGYGFHSPSVFLELDRLAQPPVLRFAVRPRAHQLPSQSESFRCRNSRDLLGRFDIAKGVSSVDWHEGRAGHGLALGFPAQSLLAACNDAVRVSSCDELRLGARGRRAAFRPRTGRRAVKLVRVLSRIVLLSLAAGAFVGLTGLYGRSIRTPLPDPIGQAERQHRPSEPQVSQFPEFIGYFFLFVFWAGIGRMGLRLRLSPVSRSERQPISLNLRRGRPGQTT
jgi:hypothetical protein